MKLTVLYGESVCSYCVIYDDNDDNDDTKIIEMAPFHHQICFSNEFAPGWKKTDGWYMGCCWVNGLENLTRKQLQDILKNVPKALGEFVYGTTVEDTVISVEKKLDRLMSYIVSNSIILLENVSWKWNNINGFKQRVQTMLDGEAEFMSPH